MGKNSKRSHRRSDSDESFDFYQHLEETGEGSWEDYGQDSSGSRVDVRFQRSSDDPFGERKRRRNRRRGGRRSYPRGERRNDQRWEDAG